MRSMWLRMGIVGALWFMLADPFAAPVAAPAPVASGAVPEELAPIDRTASALLAKYGVPGMALAVSKAGRLVMARGYGYADAERGIPVAPDSLFRLASVSKAITATAADKLVEMGRLRYDSKVFDVLSSFTPLTGARDPRLHEMTVEQLINHKSGWSDEIGGNRYAHLQEAAALLRLPLPGTFAGLIRFEIGRPLDYAPGSRTHYCNFCYGVLAQVVETAAGKDYERFIIDDVLRPVQIRRVRVGSHRADRQATGEVVYYGEPGNPRVPSVYADTPGLVPVQYGGFSLDWGVGAGAGAWIGSPVHMLRLVASVTLGTAPAMFARAPRNGFAFSGLPIGRGWLWRHDGGLPGTATTLHIADDTAWCIVTNSSRGGALINELDKTIETFVKSIPAWPATDYFSTYSDVAMPPR